VLSLMALGPGSIAIERPGGAIAKGPCEYGRRSRLGLGRMRRKPANEIAIDCAFHLAVALIVRQPWAF
jgi:hypothetical protein